MRVEVLLIEQHSEVDYHAGIKMKIPSNKCVTVWLVSNKAKV